MKTEKIFSAGRNVFTEPRFSESSTGITKKCASARFYEMCHGSVKSDIPICGQAIIPSNLNEFTVNQKFHHTAKLVC